MAKLAPTDAMTGAPLASVRRYAPGQHQGRHADRHSRVSLVLSGGVCEESPFGVLRLAPGDVLLKSRQVLHEDRFGDGGAVILSLEFVEDDPFTDDAPAWRRRDDPGAIQLGAALLEATVAQDARGLGAIAMDLASNDDEALVRADRPPPAWLTRLRDELEAEGLARVDVARRALEAGVHAVHASRLFRRCFGRSITEHAQRHAVRRATVLMTQPGAALSDVAVAAGFYDQSHMIRVFRRVSGRPPGRLRGLMGQLAARAG